MMFKIETPLHRKKKQFFFLTIVCIVIGIVGFFFLQLPVDAPRSLKALWDLGHIAFFFILTFLLIFSWEYFGKTLPKNVWFFCALVFSFSIILGVSVEVLQGLGHRHPSLNDVVSDVLGAELAACYFVYSRYKNRLKTWVPHVILGIMVLFLCYQFSPLYRMLQDEKRAIQQFPLLASFEFSQEITRFDSSLAKITIVNEHVSDGRHALKIDFSQAKYSSIDFDFVPRDWSGWATLEFDLYSQALINLEVYCHIYDQRHRNEGMLFNDRFKTVFLIEPGMNHLKVRVSDIKNAPDLRQTNMKDIVAFSLFTMQAATNSIFFLDNIRLTQ